MFTPGLLILILIGVILYFAVWKTGKPGGKQSGRQGYTTVEDRYHAQRKQRQDTIDAILDKIHRRGKESLTKKERELLEEHSRSIR